MPRQMPFDRHLQRSLVEMVPLPPFLPSWWLSFCLAPCSILIPSTVPRACAPRSLLPSPLKALGPTIQRSRDSSLNRDLGSFASFSELWRATRWPA
eukprot:3758606-Alexandrium_andersonii.AAC.1